MAGALAVLLVIVGFMLTVSARRIRGDRILKWQLESAAESCFIFAALFLMVFGFYVFSR